MVQVTVYLSFLPLFGVNILLPKITSKVDICCYFSTQKCCCLFVIVAVATWCALPPTFWLNLFFWRRRRHPGRNKFRHILDCLHTSVTLSLSLSQASERSSPDDDDFFKQNRKNKRTWKKERGREKDREGGKDIEGERKRERERGKVKEREWERGKREGVRKREIGIEIEMKGERST